MAIMRRVSWASPRRKKWEHFKLKFRKLAFRISLLLNYGLAGYIAHERGLLTNIFEVLSKNLLPWWEWLKLMLPL